MGVSAQQSSSSSCAATPNVVVVAAMRPCTPAGRAVHKRHALQAGRLVAGIVPVVAAHYGLVRQGCVCMCKAAGMLGNRRGVSSPGDS